MVKWQLLGIKWKASVQLHIYKCTLMQLSEKCVLLVVLLLALPHSGMIYGNTIADHSSSGKQMALVSLLLRNCVERLLL